MRYTKYQPNRKRHSVNTNWLEWQTYAALLRTILRYGEPWWHAFLQLGLALSAHMLVVVYGPVFILAAVFYGIGHVRAYRLSSASNWFACALALPAAFFTLFVMGSSGGASLPHLNLASTFLLNWSGSHNLLFSVVLVTTTWPVLGTAWRVLAAGFFVWVVLALVGEKSSPVESLVVTLMGGLVWSAVLLSISRKFSSYFVERLAGWLARRARLK